MKTKNTRFRLFADWKLQGIICLRICVYWVFCQFAFVATIFGFLALSGLEQSPGVSQVMPWSFIVPAIVVSSTILPIALYDMVKFSNRFAGPLLRTRQQMQLLADGEDVPTLHFRPNDYCTDLSRNLNEIRSQLAEKQNNDVSHEETHATDNSSLSKNSRTSTNGSYRSQTVPT